LYASDLTGAAAAQRPGLEAEPQETPPAGEGLYFAASIDAVSPNPMRVFRTAVPAVLWALCTASLGQSAATHQHSFGDAEKWARAFDDPERDAWQKPHEVIRALALAPDAAVADIGSGTGYFAVRLAHAVAKGRVYGVDIEPAMVKYLGERAKREGLSNVFPVAGRADDPRLPTKVDLVLMVDVYHHVANRERYFARLAGSLKPGARVAIIDFREDSSMGPPKRERIAPSRVKEELARAGYVPVEEHSFLPDQYFLIFKPLKR
jgi:SAM-dependent methyltransferase